MGYRPSYVNEQAVAERLSTFSLGGFDYMQLKFEESLRDTSLALILKQEEIERARQGTAISEAEWRNSREFYRPGLEYESGMTRELAKMQVEAYDRAQFSEEMSKRTSAANEVLGFVGTVGGAAFDVLNYVPYANFLPKALAAKLAANTVKASALKNAFEGGVGAAAMQPLLGATREDLQLDYDAGYAAHDIAAGTGAGLVFGAVGKYAIKKLTGLEASPKDPTDVTPAPPPTTAEPLVQRELEKVMVPTESEFSDFIQSKIREYDDQPRPKRATLRQGYDIRPKKSLLEAAWERSLGQEPPAKTPVPRHIPEGQFDGTLFSGRLNQFANRVKYEVVEADRLVTSTDAKGVAAKKYPQRLAKLSTDTQEQIRTKIASIADNPDIDVLASRSFESRSGAPVITGKRQVLDGNARALGIIEMQRANPEAAAAYRAKLVDNGFLPADSTIRNPILVRRIEEPDKIYQRKGGQQLFVRHANEDYAVQRFDSEIAVADGKRVSDQTVSLYDDTVPLTDKANNAFYNELAADVLTESGQQRLFMAGGDVRAKLSDADNLRVQNAFYGKVFDDLGSIGEINSTPNSLTVNKINFGKIHRNAKKIVDSTMGDFVQLISRLEAGLVDPHSTLTLIDSYRKAVREVADLKERGISLEQRIDEILEADPQLRGEVQTGNGDEIDAKTVRIMQIFSASGEKPEIGIRYMKQLAREVSESNRQGVLPGTGDQVPVGGLLDLLAGKANAEANPGVAIKGPRAADEDLRFDEPNPLPAEDLDTPPPQDAQLFEVENQQLDSELGDLSPEEKELLSAASTDVKTTNQLMDAIQDVAPCAIRTS